MEYKKTIKKELYSINGINYNSFEEIPEEIRRNLDKNGNGKIDFVEDLQSISNTSTQQSYEINGKKYDSISDVPKEFQSFFDGRKQNIETKKVLNLSNTDHNQLHRKSTHIKNIIIVIIIFLIGIIIGMYGNNILSFFK